MSHALRPEVISKITDNMVGEDIPHARIEELDKTDLKENGSYSK